MKIQKQKVEEEIEQLFEKAKKLQKNNPELSRRAIRKAFKLAMHFHIKLRNKKRFFCRKCFSLFTSKNSRRRIKNKTLTITCLNCGYIRRYKFK